MTTEESSGQVELTNGDDKADSKAEVKTDEGKPEESDSTASRKRPREDEEGTYLLVQYYVEVNNLS